jgi:hypothetical protein
MKDPTRREFITLGLAATAATVLARAPQAEGTTLAKLQDTILQVRYSCFYQVSRNVIDLYADPEHGLPNDEGHIHIFAHSHSSVSADPSLADYIHNAGSSFAYAPAFDLHKYTGWYTASEDQLAAWAREFRDTLIAAGADYYSFNELPSNAGRDARMRAQIMTLLSYLSEPDDSGNQLQGVFFMTHGPSMPAGWNNPGSDFWQRVNDTSVLVVAEHYHGYGFICNNTEAFLANHCFAMREWLNRSGDPAKVEIANGKFTVLHSSRYGPGPSGWQGGDSNVVSLAQFQRDLSKCAKVTRHTPGGFNRIAFAPMADSYTDRRVHPRIRLLINWHYNQDGGDRELSCVDSAPVNCRC